MRPKLQVVTQISARTPPFGHIIRHKGYVKLTALATSPLGKEVLGSKWRSMRPRKEKPFSQEQSTTSSPISLALQAIGRLRRVIFLHTATGTSAANHAIT